MEKKIYGIIADAQERTRWDPEHQAIREEYERLNARFLQQLAAMKPQQKEAVMDYCGLLIELNLRTLKTIVELKLEGESK